MAQKQYRNIDRYRDLLTRIAPSASGGADASECYWPRRKLGGLCDGAEL